MLMEKGYPVLVKRDRSRARSIWNAIKHAWGIASKEIDEAMKE